MTTDTSVAVKDDGRKPGYVLIDFGFLQRLDTGQHRALPALSNFWLRRQMPLAALAEVTREIRAGDFETPVAERIRPVLEFGARKYADWNWYRGFAWSRPYNALVRHLMASARGEAVDPETGLPHADHALCNVFFLAGHVMAGLGTDDRPILP